MFPSHHCTPFIVWKLKAGAERSVGAGKGVTAISGATVPSSGMRYVKCPSSRAVSSSLRREERACAGPDGFCARRRRSSPRGFRGLRGHRACHCDPVWKSRISGSPGHSRQFPGCPAQAAELAPSAILGVGPEEFCDFSSGVPAGECRSAFPAARTGLTWPPSSPGAEGLRGSGAGAIFTGHSPGRPSRAAPGVSEGLVQLQKQGPVSLGEHT